MDQLFKNKLGDHRLPPSAEAWSKVEAGLKKNNTLIAWRIAAVFVLFTLATGGWLYRQAEQVRSPEPTVKKGDNNDLNSIAEIQKPVAPAVKTEKEEVSPLQKAETFQKKMTTEIKKPDEKPNVMMEETMMITKGESITVAENISVETVAKIEKPVVIEFTLDPVPSTKELVVQNNETEKTTNLKKILEKARDIKNGESDLGILRDAKNELFAFDFRKDKTKRN